VFPSAEPVEPDHATTRTDDMALLLALVLFVALLLIPLGLPGTWLMVLAGIAYTYLVPGTSIGVVTIVGVLIIAVIAELLEFTVAAKYTRMYGGSKRGAWGAIIGGLVGAITGVPIPIIGSVLGAIAGSFVGALVGEYSGGAGEGEATRAATGAAIGRAVAMGLKAGAGCVIAVWLLASAIL
jgi:uncharacterized protein YqgC (DUF456 family)